MAHLLGLCRQLKICHLYGTFNFSTKCIMYGDRKLVCLPVFVVPSTKENRMCGSVNYTFRTSCVASFLVWNVGKRGMVII